MKKIIASLITLALVFSMFTISAFAFDEQVDLESTNGCLNITEAGTYVLTGKMTGTVLVDPGEGDVVLVLDGADIDGGNTAAIAALSGDSLTVTLPEGSVNRVTGGDPERETAITEETYAAAIYSEIDTAFDGDGALYVTCASDNGICLEKADLTFNGGSYAIRAIINAMTAETVTINGGHFSIQAQNSVDPEAEFIMNGGVIDEVAPETQAAGAGSSYAADGTDTAYAQDQPEVQTEEIPEAGRQSEAPSLPSDNTAQYSGSADQNTEAFNGTAQADQPAQPSFNTAQGNQPTPPSGDMAQPGSQPQMPAEGAQTDWQTVLNSSESASEVVEGMTTNSAADLEADYENATYITVTDDENEVVITSSGTYVVTGTCSDGNITVKKETTGVVLVLEDLDLTSTSGAAVSVNKEAEVKIIISGTVVLTDNENPEDEDSEDEEVADAFDGAALKIKDNSQVYMTGDGTLIIYGNAKNGIKCGDESSLVIDGVTVNITAANDGINSNYDLALLSGSFTIAAGDDAIHADHILTIGEEDGTGPVIRVTESTEGLEGTVINIYGGDISVVSSDDAVNAANGDGLYEGVLDYSFNMMGGRLVIDSTGDGIDSNGNVNLIGGSAQINSSTEAGEAGIDYDGQLYISDEFELNNSTGTSGPDNMMGGMPGQEFGGQEFGGQEFGGQEFGGQSLDGQQFGGQSFGGQQFGNQAPWQNAG